MTHRQPKLDTMPRTTVRLALLGLCAVLAVGLAVDRIRAADTGDAVVAETGLTSEAEAVSDTLANAPMDTAELAAAVEAPAVVTDDVAPKAMGRIRIIRMEVTAYCACRKCCGASAHGVTASGKTVKHNGGRFVAADTSVLPFGTKVLVPGYSERAVEVIDRGGAIKGNRLDVFYATHDEALQWGRRMVMVTVVE